MKTRRAILLTAAMAVVMLGVDMYLYTLIEDIRRQPVHQFKTIFNQTYTASTRPQILLWTTRFQGMRWLDRNQEWLKRCAYGCDISGNKHDLNISDAVVFHTFDISWKRYNYNIGKHLTMKLRFPDFRSRNQIWVMHNWEPKTKIWADVSEWNGLFNWTWTYQADSEIFERYSTFTEYSIDEKKSNFKRMGKIDWSLGKDRMAISMISNCYDEARRYKIRHKLAKIFNIDFVGSCDATCKDCDRHLHRYKFYLAFENSNCKDYVTEKFWGALERDQIPIVAWRDSMTGIVPTNSYINVNDFSSVETAGQYIRRVGNNCTLYNSYFQWRQSYRLGGEQGICQLCRKLKTEGQPAQVYTDLEGWLKNDTCQLDSVASWLHQVLDRFLFKIGLNV